MRTLSAELKYAARSLARDPGIVSNPTIALREE
jgi:hypothetical protein